MHGGGEVRGTEGEKGGGGGRRGGGGGGGLGREQRVREREGGGICKCDAS